MSTMKKKNAKSWTKKKCHFNMKNYSIIEGIIRQSTNNPIKKTNEPKPNNIRGARETRRPTTEHGERGIQKDSCGAN